ncbi:MAG TPA: ABC-F family ATP-binding cassette domain-containing protein [Peptococcaceae bacterium]|nr:ABC-F family ATP-binding cassette domain-containing protein [Peptococcaceae bacterium]
MSILVAKNLNIEAAGNTILENISFRLEQGEKAGLIGANGAGKTTLLKAIVGEIEPAQGEIHCSVSIGYLPQTAVNSSDSCSVFEAMLVERQDILDMRNRLRHLEIRMSQNTETKILEQYSNLLENYQRAGGYALEAQVRRILSGLGLSQEQDKVVSALSGGQKTRLALGKLLLKEPELLILDEPTNHLDLEALEWLESYLEEYTGAVLVVSHDRYFLDKVVSQILLIQNGGLKQYRGGYSEFELQYATEQLTLRREAEKIKKKITSLEEYIRRHKAGIKAKQARGREKQLKKISPVEIPSVEKSININLKTNLRSGDLVLKIEDLSISYEQKKIVENVQLDLRRGNKIALLGHNGVGKTSLLRAIIGKVPYEGKIRLGANVKIGYYSQEHENIGLRDTVIDEIRYSCNLEDPEIRNLLARFGFRGEDVFKPIRVLSGGEKSRLALCKLFLEQGNLLLLDEPTNHLDMETREVLEETLIEYDGTLIVVSHDRYFLNRIVNRIAVLTPKALTIVDGDYTSYRELMDKEALERDLENSDKCEQPRTAKIYLEESKEIKRKERKIRQLEEKIEETEAQLKDLERKLELAGSDYEQILELHNQHQNLQGKLDDLMQEWLAMQE